MHLDLCCFGLAEDMMTTKKQPNWAVLTFGCKKEFLRRPYELSSTSAPGALLFTDAIPFSMAEELEYISLAPMT